MTSGSEDKGFMTPEEADRRFEGATERYLGMSGPEFIEKFRSGKLDPCDADVSMVRVFVPLKYYPLKVEK